MSTPTFIKTLTATAAIVANTIVKVGTADFEATPATAVSDAVIGVADGVGQPTAGDRVDVVLSGIADVKLGGTVARGGLVTTNASSVGVAAAPVAGTNNAVIGRALQSGVTGDIIEVLLMVGQIQG